MIVAEDLIINGIEFIRTYSDKGFMIERNGELYSEAIDPIRFNRKYTETDIPIEEQPEEE